MKRFIIIFILFLLFVFTLNAQANEEPPCNINFISIIGFLCEEEPEKPPDTNMTTTSTSIKEKETKPVSSTTIVPQELPVTP